jgi:hypothetical protein
MANVSTHQLKPLELSAMDVGCSSDNNNGDGKPTTATISALRTNDSVAATTTTAPNKAVYRLGHSDTWACKNCKIKADKHFMHIHDWSGKK